MNLHDNANLVILLHGKTIKKEVPHGVCFLKRLAYIFQIRHSFKRPCSHMVYCYFLGVFLSWKINTFNLKVILYAAKIVKNTATELL